MKSLYPALLAAGMIFAPAHVSFVSEALAAGGSKPAKSEAKECKRGQVYSERRKKCVRDDSAALTSEDRYQTGRAFALDGRFEDAVVTLAAANQDDPRVLNYLGYSSRKAGRLSEGMRYYEAALALDPDFALARSYMGQALLQQGDRDGAEAQLARIETISGTRSDEYLQLYDALREGRSRY